MTLNDSNGNFIRIVHALNPSEGSFYDITSINTHTIAVYTVTCINIVNIDTHNKLHKIQSNRVCYGMTHCDGKLYYCSDWEGIRRIKKDLGQYSYISSDGNKLFCTSNTGTVTCCDMNGKQIWKFQDTSLLRSPRGVVVDNQGFVFVAGEKSRYRVMISPDGNSAKEVYQISSPRGMCYDKSENEILVCHTDRKASWFQISLDV